MASLYADENFHGRAVQELRQLGYDVLTAHDAGLANRGVPDADQLAFAASQGRAIVTHNRRHFVRLHQQAGHHAGIIVCTADSDFAALAQRIHTAIGGEATLDDKLIRVNKPAKP
jgi:predicted nuclease of predicted toxin-antitoxin system